MYTRLSRLIKAASLFFLLGTGLAVQQKAQALTSDQKQPIKIEADRGELDNARGVTVYTGHVVVTQGSIRITGRKMTIHYNKKNEIEVLIVEGNPATYRQLPDSSKVYDQAQAKRMEYHKKENLVTLIGDARVKQEKGTLSGDRIEYDSAHSRVRAISNPAAKGTKPGGKGRIRIIIPPPAK